MILQKKSRIKREQNRTKVIYIQKDLITVNHKDFVGQSLAPLRCDFSIRLHFIKLSHKRFKNCTIIKKCIGNRIIKLIILLKKLSQRFLNGGKRPLLAFQFK